MRENARLSEALRRSTEPGAWAWVGRERLEDLLDPADGSEPPLDGPGLRLVATWLEAARTTREAWSADAGRARFPELASLAAELPSLDALERSIEAALDPDGAVRDSASPLLR